MRIKRIHAFCRFSLPVAPALLVAVLVAAVLITAASPSTARAKVVRATLYPDSALVTESARVVPRADGVALLRLPAVADPSSLRLSASGGVVVSDVTWKRETPDESKAVQDARMALDAATARRDGVCADLDAAEAQRDFWRAQGGAGDLKASDAARLARELAEQLPKLGRLIAEKTAELADRNKDVQDAQRELDRLTSGTDASWVVQAAVGASPVELVWTYRTGGCGWRPVYTLDARPRADVVRFSFQAEIRQATGRDWKGAALTLATLAPRSGLTPPPVRPWILQPRQPQPRALAMKTMARDAAPMAEENMVAATARGPREVAMSTYAAWDLGRRDLISGRQPRVTLDREDWKAEFLYTLRPSATPDAFLTASVKLDNARELPPGQALFLVDGGVLGKRSFRAAGRELELFFGSDPLVAGDMKLDEKLTGEQGFFGKRRSMRWSWIITAENHKGYAVTVRIEDPRPQVRDERIKLTMTTRPDAKTDDDVLYWKARLGPGEKMAVTHTVQATAPEDVDLDPGR